MSPTLPVFVSKHRLAILLRTDIRRKKVTSRAPFAMLEVAAGKFLPLYDRAQVLTTASQRSKRD
jgi:hypothetical protein